MEENKSGLNWQPLLLAAVIATNLLWLPTPFKSSRPVEKLFYEHRSVGHQDMEARMWQDPFEAIKQQTKKNKADSDKHEHTIDNLVLQIKERSFSKQTVTVAPVLVTESPYTEGNEWRLRARYAVISALKVSNFVPEDAEHVGYVSLPWPEPQNLIVTNEMASVPSPATEGSQLVVAYEWFKWQDLSSPNPPSDVSTSDSVLLVWLKEERFSDFPLVRLAQFVAEIKSRLEPPLHPLLRFHFVGPWGSTMLKSMYHDNANISFASNACSRACRVGQTIKDILSGVQMVSPSATAADNMLQCKTVLHRSTNAPSRESVRKKLAEAGIEFINATCTDQELAAALLAELERRHVDLSKPEDGIALITEADTFYGQALPGTFDLQLRDRRTIGRSFPTMRFCYLRGMDGKLPTSGDSAGQGQSVKSTDQEEPKIKRLEELERPEGHSQLDYVRRLVERVKTDCDQGDQHGRHKERHSFHLRAIGIMGSDVYDKLLLLQSLRNKFSDVLFFTTDLDARLFHPSELQWSRNLIVASAFGLKLEKGLQGDIPPFRDSYQTATFLAMRIAVQPEISSLFKQFEPRLFEIGQKGAHDISVVDSSVHPQREDWGEQLSFFRAKKMWLVGIFLFLGLSLMQVNPRCRQIGLIPLGAFASPFYRDLNFTIEKPFEVSWRWVYFLIAAGAAGALFWLTSQLIVDLNDVNGEPVSFLEGISVWPTELVRVVAGSLAFFWLILAWYRLEKNRIRVAEAFCFPATAPPRTENKKWYRWFWGRESLWHYRCKTICLHNWLAETPAGKPIPDSQIGTSVNPGEEVSAERLWYKYQLLGSPGSRWIRILPAAFVYVWLGMLLVQLDPPFIPARGNTSVGVDKAVMYFCITGFVLLMFYVVDATRLCARLITNLTEGKTLWFKQTLDAFERVRGLPHAYLDEVIDVAFIAERTKVVSRLIYYPFVVLFVLIIARNHFFDRWNWPLGLIILFGLNSAYALFCALHLRRAADVAKRRSLGSLRAKLSAISSGQAIDNNGQPISLSSEKREALRDQIQLAIQEIESNEDGAFAPFSKHPIIGALLMPFGGAGLLAALEYLANH
jgi:hypothetical protein